MREVVNYTPAGSEFDCLIQVPEGERECFLYVHGGGWIGGNYDNNNLAGIFDDTTKIIASMNYRLAVMADDPADDVASYPGVYWDIQRCITFIRNNYNPTKITLIGTSAGGSLALFSTIAYRIKPVPGHKTADAMKLFYPFAVPYAINDLSPTIQEMYYCHLGVRAKDDETKQKALDKASREIGYTHLLKDMRVEIFHGLLDTDIGVQQSRSLYTFLKASSAHVSYTEIEAAHSFLVKPWV